MINAALIAGNRPERRVERLREFWDRVSSSMRLVAPVQLDPLRIFLNRFSAATAATLASRAHRAWLEARELVDGVRVYDLAG